MTEQSSTETNELATALAKARPEMPHPIKNCKNPHFNNEYADQKAIMDAISPAMGKHGLSLTFQPDGEALMMHGYLRHSSGQWLRASLPLILGQRRDMQALGAAITYAKRYLTGALLSLHHDTDDDAESMMARGPEKTTPKREVWTGKIKRAVTISELRELEEGLKSSRSEIIGEHGSGTWSRLRKAWGTRRDELAGDMLKAAAPWFADGGPFTVDVPLVSEVFEFLEQKIGAEDMAAHVIEKLGQGDNPHGKGLFASLTAEVLAHRAVDTVSSGSGASS